MTDNTKLLLDMLRLELQEKTKDEIIEDYIDLMSVLLETEGEIEKDPIPKGETVQGLIESLEDSELSEGNDSQTENIYYLELKAKLDKISLLNQNTSKDTIITANVVLRQICDCIISKDEIPDILQSEKGHIYLRWSASKSSVYVKIMDSTAMLQVTEANESKLHKTLTIDYNGVLDLDLALVWTQIHRILYGLQDH